MYKNPNANSRRQKTEGTSLEEKGGGWYREGAELQNARRYSDISGVSITVVGPEVEAGQEVAGKRNDIGAGEVFWVMIDDGVWVSIDGWVGNVLLGLLRRSRATGYTSNLVASGENIAKR
ncbi:hypothetical protein K435DRAFT_804663 [Dendrothele bispora CBS 962.96]|uniref:Uncharacterized protein n=1 Tax=Dendrothele bispora (strain CBS 962.96) TaxID=1314807 RepID=A0A4S8LDG9_DENBC|nr:hypothetical protein K435DRAFT_804663 [Dendrothele bispora CBS 962.96]